MYMKGIARFLLLLGFLSLPVVAVAQKPAFKVTAPEVVAVGEVFQVEFISDTKPDSFTGPAFEGMDILAGPSSSVFSHTVVANGNMEQVRQYRYTYVLRCNAEGIPKFQIGN